MRAYEVCVCWLILGSGLAYGDFGPALENTSVWPAMGSQPSGPSSADALAISDPCGSPAIMPAANLEVDAADGPHYVTAEELQAAVKRQAWTKGDFTISPYGILWANMVLEQGRTYPGNYPLYVARPVAGDNTDACYVDARSTRLGIDILGPQIPLFDCARSGGKVEVDFQRQIDTENKPSLLLRHAYIEVKNDDFRLLFGQTWDVISPLNPGVLFYSVGWDAGNIGYRRAQLRGERYLRTSDTFELIAQGSLDTISPTDLSGSATTYTAMPSGWPIIEGRLAALVGPRGQGCLPWEFGVSSHYGEMIYDLHQAAFNIPANEIGVTRRTWSLNTDIHIPITQFFGVQGELFIGENLAPFLGGAGQSVDVVGYGATLPSGNSIRSRGGWIDVWYNLTPQLHTHTGYSIDDPFDQDVTCGRIYNAFYFANVSYDLTAKFMVGLEYLNWRTIWAGPSVDATSNNFNFVAKYSF